MSTRADPRAPQERSDAECIAASLEAPEAFGRVYDRHAPQILRFLIRRVGLEIAEGLLADVFRIAFEQRKRFDLERQSALPWLYGIATNLLMKQRRAETRRLRASAKLLAEARSGSGADLSAASQARELWPRVAEKIASLPSPERDVLLLHVWEEMPYADIASTLSIPIGTVRSRLNRARERLRALDPALQRNPSAAGAAHTTRRARP